jgi:poly(3-hydroxybutyrate) depolymerase
MMRSICLLLLLTLPAFAADSVKSAEAIQDLKKALATSPKSLDELASSKFMTVPLSKADAATARTILWDAYVAQLKVERAEEMKAKVLKDGKMELKFHETRFGKQPKEGHSLWISLHGGGNDPSTKINDSQWENQKKLYKLDEGIYIAPRAPTNTWNLWHDSHIDTLFARLIENYVALEGVNPDRVYVLGYSAGGDGVYQIAPRMADRWAAAAMMAGHPNDADPLSLRNVPFALQVGGNDTAYNRNKVAADWGKKLDDLHKSDDKGYETFFKIHEGKGHWMQREDAAALPWMAKHTRNATPSKVVWKQSGRTHDQSYWLAVPKGEAKGGSLVIASVEKQRVFIDENKDVPSLVVRFDDRLQNLDQPVTVLAKKKELYSGTPTRTAGTLLKTLMERGDPKLMFEAEAKISLK